ncbi:MAG: hypothetical protein K9L98_00735 [Candidatus Pacebacteria bacterium]|nr:hypothetical protein [Candidatus Paceibacterota bacterium]MCF7862523.1 hypothetical protein [Candidatus Paceibacterota bacterium]
MTFTWAVKRQIVYVTILAIFFGIFGYMIIAPIIRQIPSCDDGRQNGDEAGIDCGGSCALVCIFQVDEINILWSRAFEVVPGRYNAVAYLENQNESSAIRRIRYRFRFADKNNIYIGMREGEVMVPPSRKFAVFEPALDFGNSVPVYVNFEFLETPVWVKAPEDKLKDIKLVVSDIELVDQDTAPKLSATIKNNSLFIVPEIDISAILYDKEGNAITASRTYIEEMVGGENKKIYFTWPRGIEQEAIAKEIMPTFDIFLANLKY